MRALETIGAFCAMLFLMIATAIFGTLVLVIEAMPLTVAVVTGILLAQWWGLL